MKNKNIDELIRRKLGQRQVIFNEHAWQDAEKLINKSKRKRFIMWLFWLPLAVMFTAGVMYFSPGTNDKEKEGGSGIVEYRETNGKKFLTPSPVKIKIKDKPGTSQGKANGVVRKPEMKNPAQKYSRYDELSGHKTSSRHSVATGITGMALQRLHLLMPSELQALETISAEEATFLGLIESIEMVNPNLPAKTFRPVEIGITGGFHVIRGFENGGNRAITSAANPIVGIYFGRLINYFLSINTELNYTSRAGLNADTTMQGKHYSFGLHQEEISVDIKRLHYLELPVYAELRTGGRYSVLAGMQGTYLLNTSGNVERKVSYATEPTQQSIEPAWGYTKGFNNYDLQLTIGCKMIMNERASILLRSHYGLLDITSDGHFNNTSVDRNLGLKFLFRYRFY
ncbi:MAG: outer membrane beta-barrel protein [Bacteroidia bacterium]